MKSRQMELGVPATRQELANGRHNRMRRARWWFGRMRQVVELAAPQSAGVPPRGETGCAKLRQPSLFEIGR